MTKTLTLSDIQKQISRLEKQVQEINRELEDLASAERMVLRFGSESQLESISKTTFKIASSPVDHISKIREPRTTTMKLKEIVELVLRQSTDLWLTTQDVQVAASRLRGSEIPIGSIAPTLSILKRSGEVTRNGPKIALTSRLNENEMEA